MQRVTLTVREVDIERLDARQDGENITSRAAAFRDLLDEYEDLHTEVERLRTEYEDCQKTCDRLRERLDEREARIADLEGRLAGGSDVDELRERLADLEATVEALANAGEGSERAPASGSERTPREPSSADAGGSDGGDAERDSAPVTPSASEGGMHADPIGLALAEWTPGRDLAEREARREAGRAAVEWLRDVGGRRTGAEFKRELLPEHGVDGQNPDTWWKKSARPALQRATDAGLVEYREGHHDYRWIGE